MGKLDFLQSFYIRRQIHDLHVICLNSVEAWAVQSAMCFQSMTRQDPRIRLSVKGLGTYSWTGVLGRKEPEGSEGEPQGESMQNMRSVHQRQCEEFSHASKSNWIITSKDFSISSVNRGWSKKQSHANWLTGYLLHKEFHIMWWQKRRYKQYPSPRISVKIYVFTTRQGQWFDITDLKAQSVGAGAQQSL